MPARVSQPLPYPFGFAHARRLRPLSVGRLENACHPATDHHSEIPILCKENATKCFSERRRRRFIALAVRGSRCPSLSLVSAPMFGSQEKRIALGNSPAAPREEFAFDSSIVYALDAFQLSKSQTRRLVARSMTVVCRRVLQADVETEGPPRGSQSVTKERPPAGGFQWSSCVRS